jgi:hypothetical protein
LPSKAYVRGSRKGLGRLGRPIAARDRLLCCMMKEGGDETFLTWRPARISMWLAIRQLVGG